MEKIIGVHYDDIRISLIFDYQTYNILHEYMRLDKHLQLIYQLDDF